MPAGSLLIRDMRMWRLGMPNWSDAGSNMMFIFSCYWSKTSYPYAGFGMNRLVIERIHVSKKVICYCLNGDRLG